jgi:hypothetical protein
MRLIHSSIHEGSVMGYRSGSSQSDHDRVIQVVAAAQGGFATFINPDGLHNTFVEIAGQRVYPDLILCTPGTKIIQHLIEVETAESVTDDESGQWALYAQGPGQFWLMVPSTSLDSAQEICRHRLISARFGRWWVGSARIEFGWVS